jgi:hypothetical protein
MRKTRLYLEASPIIRVGDDESPIRQAITKEFFRIVAEKSDDYELVTVHGIFPFYTEIGLFSTVEKR